MAAQVDFGRRSFSPARAVDAARPVATVAREQVSYADLDGLQRLMAAIPWLTFGFALALWAIFRLQMALAFDLAPGDAIAADSLVAQGADSFDLAIGEGEIWRLALAPLLHSSSSHLFGNALALILIGVVLEPMIGCGWFAALYAASGVGGEIGSLIGNPGWLPGVGASGAITGLIAAAFVMSFSAETPEDGVKLRRRALFFGVPALAPLAWGAHGHVNYFAHAGGALTGGGLALALFLLWDRADFRPPLHRFAGFAAALTLALAAPAAACAATHFEARRAEAAAYIPASVLEQETVNALAERAPELEQRYPADPMTRILSAVRLAEQGGLPASEAQLRTAMRMTLPKRPWAERPLHDLAQGFLAVLLDAQGRETESRRLAAPLCAGEDSPNVAQMLRQAKLCKKS